MMQKHKILLIEVVYFVVKLENFSKFMFLGYSQCESNMSKYSHLRC